MYELYPPSPPNVPKDLARLTGRYRRETNLPSMLAYHASLMYARTLVNFLRVLVRDGKVQLDLQDELIRAPLVTHDGKVQATQPS